MHLIDLVEVAVAVLASWLFWVFAGTALLLAAVTWFLVPASWDRVFAAALVYGVITVAGVVAAVLANRGGETE